MFGIMLQKIWHKKWMISCLLLGCTLLMATVVSFPMFKGAIFDRMLPDEFEQYIKENSEWPATMQLKIVCQREPGGETIQRMEALMDEIYDKMGVEEYETFKSYMLLKADASSLWDRTEDWNLSLKLGTVCGLPEHAQLISGEMYSEDGLDEEGNIEVVISQACMVESDLLLGETLEFDELKDVEGNQICLKIVGIYKQADAQDFFWQITPDKMTDTCLMNETLFMEKFTGENAKKFTITCKYFPMIEYSLLKASDVEQLQEYTNYLVNESEFKGMTSEPDYIEILDDFLTKQSRIESTLLILQIPVLILLCAFLLMISSQMYDMERNEISVIKSRGSNRGQIFRLYLYQSLFLTFLGSLLGIPLGAFLCRILGSARNFLEFDMSNTLTAKFSTEVLWYGLGAACVCILVMTIPALKHSSVSIVKLKQQKVTKKRPLWEKCFLDVICIGIGLYGYYNFSENEATLVENVLQGKPLDPLLYISSSVFIVGLGLLFLRLQALLIKLIYYVGKNHWKPANYTFFSEIIRNGRKQQFIMLFMILIISLGMYHATVARSILQNALDNTEYLVGADVILQEKWTDNSYMKGSAGYVFQYTEPDYRKYGTFDGIESYTKVIYNTKSYIVLNDKSQQTVTLMGIHTKEFGENTNLDNSLLEKQYYEYLNELAVEPNGILVSRNFQSLLEYEVGDKIAYYDETYYGGEKKQITARIVDFVDYWPGYEPTTTVLNQDGSITTADNYLIIANIATINQEWGLIPYQVWITLNEDVNTQDMQKWIQEEEMRLTKYINRAEKEERTEENPLLQGTNGVLTMGFIVTILLCAVGYLIYWIMSIRSRELIFGVLRACGMHKGEVFQMLINEQICSGVFSIFAGMGIGKLTSDMFVPMIQTAYMAESQVLPMRLITNQGDMFRLYGVILGVMAVCLCVLVVLVLKLNVVKALKLGEE